MKSRLFYVIVNSAIAVVYVACALYLIVNIFYAMTGTNTGRDRFDFLGMALFLGWLFPPVALANIGAIVMTVLTLSSENHRKNRSLPKTYYLLLGALGFLVMVIIACVIIALSAG